MICLLVPMMLMLSGCASKPTVCPQFPKPSTEAVIAIQGLENQKVDEWMVELYKLQLKLER